MYLYFTFPRLLQPPPRSLAPPSSVLDPKVLYFVKVEPIAKFLSALLKQKCHSFHFISS